MQTRFLPSCNDPHFVQRSACVRMNRGESTNSQTSHLVQIRSSSGVQAQNKCRGTKPTYTSVTTQAFKIQPRTARANETIDCAHPHSQTHHRYLGVMPQTLPHKPLDDLLGSALERLRCNGILAAQASQKPVRCAKSSTGEESGTELDEAGTALPVNAPVPALSHELW